jgi:hypothetical protein
MSNSKKPATPTADDPRVFEIEGLGKVRAINATGRDFLKVAQVMEGEGDYWPAVMHVILRVSKDGGKETQLAQPQWLNLEWAVFTQVIGKLIDLGFSPVA